MVKHSAAALAALWFAATGPASRAAGTDLEFYTGQTLYLECSADAAQPDGAAHQARCEAYVMGVSDALQAAAGSGDASSRRETHGVSAVPGLTQVTRIPSVT